MIKKIPGLSIAALLMLLTAATPPSSFAQQALIVADEMEQSRALNDAKRQATINANMNFTTEEMGKFWPLYWEYRTAVGKIDEEFIRIIREYADKYQSLSNREAKKLTEAALNVEMDRYNLKRQYVEKFGSVLPAAKTLRVMQIEKKLDAMVDASVTKQIPLVVPKD